MELFGGVPRERGRRFRRNGLGPALSPRPNVNALFAGDFASQRAREKKNNNRIVSREKNESDSVNEKNKKTAGTLFDGISRYSITITVTIIIIVIVVRRT